MTLYIFLLLLSPVCSQTDSLGYNSGDICIPVIVCLCQALLLSIAVNIYFICMIRYRETCQLVYNDYITVWCSCNTPNEPYEQTDDQVQAVAPRFSALNISNDKSEESEEQTEESTNVCVYSDVKHC